MHRRLYTTDRYKAQCFSVFSYEQIWPAILPCFVLLPLYLLQARTIQELGRKKFEKLRIKFERTQVELKSEQKTQSNSSVKKSLKKPPGWASQESVSFDLSYGEVQLQPTSYPMQGGSCERPGTIDGIVEANAFFIDANQDKAEDVLSGNYLKEVNML